MAVTAGENIETAMVAPTSGVASEKRTTMSEAIECPSTARRPSPSGRAKSAMRAVSATRVRVAPSASVMLPVSGAGLRAWPAKSKVTAT